MTRTKIDRCVLFLDVDGVLNSGAFYDRIRRDPPPRPKVDPEAVARLARVLRATGCVIVVSSAWRSGTVAATRRTFQQYGICPPRRIVGVTPRLEPSAERGDEIFCWLAQHPEVRTYAIVDDDADMGGYGRFLVQTDERVGLTDKDADDLIDRLSRRVIVTTLPAAETREAWQMNETQYLTTLGVHDPWIAEVSAFQRSRMSTRAAKAYDAQRRREWDAAGQAKNAWKAACINAHADGSFRFDDPRASPAAVDAVQAWLQVQKDRKAVARRVAVEMQVRAENAITSAEELQRGQRVWSVFARAYLTILRVNRVTAYVEEPFHTPRLCYTTRIAGFLTRASPDDEAAEVARRLALPDDAQGE